MSCHYIEIGFILKFVVFGLVVVKDFFSKEAGKSKDIFIKSTAKQHSVEQISRVNMRNS